MKKLTFSKAKQLKHRVFEDQGSYMAVPKKKVKKSTLKKKAWAAFSRWVRYSHADHAGYVVCYTCGKKDLWKKMHAGHGIGGRNNAVLFDKRLVRPQCVGCNIFAGGRYQVFMPKLLAELGEKEFTRMVEEAKRVVKYTDADYQAIYNTYKEAV